MIYFLEVFAFTFTIELNTLTWTFGSTFFFEIRILKSYAIWPNIMAISVLKNWYPPFRFAAFALLCPPATIEFISGRFAILFTWVVVIELVKTIWGVPIILVVAGNAKLQLKFLITKTPLDLLPNFSIDPISTPLLTTFMLSTITISTLVVSILASNDWITPTLTCVSRFQQLPFPTLLVELCWHEIDNIPVCGYPLVSIMVQYVDVNTPLVFYS
jgi:hypothetical protein